LKLASPRRAGVTDPSYSFFKGQSSPVPNPLPRQRLKTRPCRRRRCLRPVHGTRGVLSLQRLPHVRFVFNDPRVRSRLDLRAIIMFLPTVSNQPHRQSLLLSFTLPSG
jgi:hypothetical protein